MGYENEVDCESLQAGFVMGQENRPCVVKCVQQALVGPRVRRRVQPDLTRRVGFDLTKEWEGSVEMGVPCNRPDGCSCCSS